MLAIGTLSFSSCTDYINVDKYFYDQVSLDSAFSKRVYVEGWLSSAYSVMDYIGEYREPFRWASDDLYHPDMKDYVEGNYSADNQTIAKHSYYIGENIRSVPYTKTGYTFQGWSLNGKI